MSLINTYCTTYTSDFRVVTIKSSKEIFDRNSESFPIEVHLGISHLGNEKLIIMVIKKSTENYLMTK